MRFIANYFHLFLQNGGKQPIISFIETLKVQFDLRQQEETMTLNLDENGIVVVAQLIDWLAKKNLNEDETAGGLALETEELLQLQIWNKYLRLANQFFKDLRLMMRDDEWDYLQNVLNVDNEKDYRKVA